MSRRAPGLRPIGPIAGEVIVAIARRRNSQHNTRDRLMTEQELKSLRIVIQFLWRDEQKHFEDMKAAGVDRGDHIFRHLELLDGYLLREQASDAIDL